MPSNAEEEKVSVLKRVAASFEESADQLGSIAKDKATKAKDAVFGSIMSNVQGIVQSNPVTSKAFDMISSFAGEAAEMLKEPEIAEKPLTAPDVVPTLENSVDINDESLSILETISQSIDEMKEGILDAWDIDRNSNAELVKQSQESNKLAEVVRKENRENAREAANDQESPDIPDAPEDAFDFGFLKPIIVVWRIIKLGFESLLAPLIGFASMFDGIMLTLEQGWKEWQKTGSLLDGLLVTIKNFFPNIGTSVMAFFDSIVNWVSDKLGFEGPDFNLKAVLTDATTGLIDFVMAFFDTIGDAIRSLPMMGDFGLEDSAATKIRKLNPTVTDRTENTAEAAMKKLGIDKNFLGAVSEMDDQSKLGQLSTDELKALITTNSVDGSDRKALDIVYNQRIVAMEAKNTAKDKELKGSTTTKAATDKELKGSTTTKAAMDDLRNAQAVNEELKTSQLEESSEFKSSVVKKSVGLSGLGVANYNQQKTSNSNVEILPTSMPSVTEINNDETNSNVENKNAADVIKNQKTVIYNIDKSSVASSDNSDKSSLTNSEQSNSVSNTKSQTDIANKFNSAVSESQTDIANKFNSMVSSVNSPVVPLSEAVSNISTNVSSPTIMKGNTVTTAASADLKNAENSSAKAKDDKTPQEQQLAAGAAFAEIIASKSNTSVLTDNSMSSISDNVSANSNQSEIVKNLERVESESTSLKEQKIQRDREVEQKASAGKGGINIVNNNRSITSSGAPSGPTNYKDPVSDMLLSLQRFGVP